MDGGLIVGFLHAYKTGSRIAGVINGRRYLYGSRKGNNKAIHKYTGRVEYKDRCGIIISSGTCRAIAVKLQGNLIIITSEIIVKYFATYNMRCITPKRNEQKKCNYEMACPHVMCRFRIYKIPFRLGPERAIVKLNT
jgi:hypothetical protein